MVHILWPDNLFLTDEEILSRYRAAVGMGLVDGHVDSLVQDAHDAAQLLDEAGLITLARNE